MAARLLSNSEKRFFVLSVKNTPPVAFNLPPVTIADTTERALEVGPVLGTYSILPGGRDPFEIGERDTHTSHTLHTLGQLVVAKRRFPR
jgi:hypothetical protein